jgi:hypothetical protein
MTMSGWAMITFQSHDNEWVGNDQVQSAKVRVQGGWRVTGLHHPLLTRVSPLLLGVNSIERLILSVVPLPTPNRSTHMNVSRS